MTDTDQPRLARSRLLVADAFERDRAAATKPDAHDLAAWMLDQLADLGWKPPPGITEIPPLRPDHVADDDSPGRREFRVGMCLRYGHQPDDGHCRRCGTTTGDTTARTMHHR